MEERNQRVTLRTLAERLSLSLTTVSVVIANSPAAQAIPLETRTRILEAAAELDYRPNYFARSLSKSLSMSVGVLAPELSEGYFTLVMNGVEEYLLKEKYFYFLACHYWDKKLMAEYPCMLIERAVDGLLLLNTPEPAAVRIPTVAISGSHRVAGVTNIQLDHQKAALLAVTHLTELGHRRIVFMKGQPFTSDTECRWDNILEIVSAKGLVLYPELQIHLETNIWSPELGYAPMKELLSRTRDFTAVLCFNDTSALGTIRALHEAGLSVPRDVSVVGFDDILGARFSIPSLTTIRQPLRAMGMAGAEILLNRIRQPDQPYPEKVMMEPELVVRESTARPSNS